MRFTVLLHAKTESEKKEQKKVELEQVKTIENEIEENVYPCQHQQR